MPSILFNIFYVKAAPTPWPDKNPLFKTAAIQRLTELTTI